MIRAIIVMGVSGCGKSTLGRALAQTLGWTFVEGDECHPPANLAKMAAGVPLTDADRTPFLRRVADELTRYPGGAVASCSALKRAYRDVLRAQAGGILFVLPVVEPAALVRRMADRPGHFMPASLLASQLQLLEPPAPDEHALLVDGHLSVGAQVAVVRQELKPA